MPFQTDAAQTDGDGGENNQNAPTARMASVLPSSWLIVSRSTVPVCRKRNESDGGRPARSQPGARQMDRWIVPPPPSGGYMSAMLNVNLPTEKVGPRAA